MEWILALRSEELSRRVALLPKEFSGWRNRANEELDLQIHVSQLNALSTLIDAFGEQQKEILKDLNSSAGKNLENYKTNNMAMIASLIESQRVWDFFRDKLELRFSPDFKDILWVADTVAWNCHRSVLEMAEQLNILELYEFREPPLTYITSEFSAATWVRGSRPNDGRDYQLGTTRLPIPVIEIPSDHLGNVWELITLCHEVGHDLEADLKLRKPMESSLKENLQKAGVPADRQVRWAKWIGEVFADLVGLQLGGPWFADSLTRMLLLDTNTVTTISSDDPHPTHYVRILMNAAYIKTLHTANPELEKDANRIRDQWRDLYGNLDEQPNFAAYVGDFPIVFESLMDTKFAVLKDRTVRSLMEYSPSDDAKIRQLSEFLLTGLNKPSGMKPRHCISAAVLAANKASEQGTLNLLNAIDAGARAMVRDVAPSGVRGGDGSAKHQQFIKDFVGQSARQPALLAL